MKKLFLLSTLITISAHAITFYEDSATHQIFTQPGDGRVAIGDYVKKSNINKEITSTVLNTSKKMRPKITIVDQGSPEFLLGKQTHINMKFVADDNPDMWLKAGVRIQGSFVNLQTDYNDVTKSDTDLMDSYLRRVRFEVAAGFNKMTSFVMDVRNDKANYGLSNGEGTFNVGDAYVKIKKPFDTSLVNFKLYRAKIDVSRTETVKSARTIVYDRPHIADEAAQYISHNRRATNAQMYGDYKKKIHYQVAFGDATHNSKLKDSTGAKATGSAEDQSYFFGGKVVLSPFDGWEEKKKTETYFGEGKHFSLGAGYWNVLTTKGKTDANADYNLNHELINIEASGHYEGLFAQAEYFKFKDVVKDWSAATIEKGKSDGWYATSEYVMKELNYIAPFVRYETWDKYKGGGDYTLTSKMAGINWYLMGNTIKAGLIYQEDEYGKDIGDKKITSMRVASQFFF